METKNNGGWQWWQVEQHSWTFPLFFFCFAFIEELLLAIYIYIYVDPFIMRGNKSYTFYPSKKGNYFF